MHGVARADLTDVDLDPFGATYRFHEGDEPVDPPGEQGFWAVSVEGASRRILEWEVESGRWAVVIMNADGSPGVGVDASLGVKADRVLPVGIGLAIAAAVGAIPHYVVLGILGGGLFVGWTNDNGWSANGPGLIAWFALVAAVVVLFTDHHPWGIFDLVVGLNRWVYRFIPYAVLITDRYPPFRLDEGGTEPTPAAATAPRIRAVRRRRSGPFRGAVTGWRPVHRRDRPGSGGSS